MRGKDAGIEQLTEVALGVLHPSARCWTSNVA
jgi:hypothetical protein